MIKQKNQSGFAHMVILVVILVIALIGTLGFVYYQNFIQNKTDDVVKDKEEKTTQKTEIAAETDTDKTANWESASFGDITFKYQPDWVKNFNSSTPTGGYLQTDVKSYNELNKKYYYVSVSISKASTSKSNLEDAVADFVSKVSTSVDSSKKTSIKVNGQPALRYDNAGCPGCIANQVYFLAGGNLYIVQDSASAIMGDAQGYLNTFDDKFNLFLSTIKY